MIAALLPVALVGALLGGWGCAKPAAPPPGTASPAAPPPLEPAGAVVDGVFHDARYGLTVRLPPGWTASPGTEDSAMRVRLDGRGASPTRVELWRFGEPALRPRDRSGCSWTFEDVGPYFGVPGAEDILLATCTPEAPTEPRVFAWITVMGAATWQLEVHAPSTRMLDAHDEGAAVLATIRWNDEGN